jgi:hypothetical protein
MMRYHLYKPGLSFRGISQILKYSTIISRIGLEQGPLSLIRIIEELLEWKSL